jgi:hypothetical protein
MGRPEIANYRPEGRELMELVTALTSPARQKSNGECNDSAMSCNVSAYSSTLASSPWQKYKNVSVKLVSYKLEFYIRLKQQKH